MKNRIKDSSLGQNYFPLKVGCTCLIPILKPQVLLVNLNIGKDRQKDVYKENKRKKSEKEDPFKTPVLPDSLAGKEPFCKAGDPGLIPGWGRS